MNAVSVIGLDFLLITLFRYSGVLCPDHYDRDERRAHWHPNVLYLLDQFQAVRFSELETISLQAEMKAALRQAIDQLYEEYVGIHLKAKKVYRFLE